ncbi:hypothetical protein AX17_004217 [Amanita inopinata Kibby_2008]|nr:hypothetical protein AX17_004217 [Amanita inopinata Kibby_2008]
MQRRRVLVGPSASSPFYVEGLQYIPDRSYDDGFTLIMFHAMNLHKETFEVLLTRLMGDVHSSVKFRDAWCIENPNHGRSASLNQKLLTSPEYVDNWTALEYSRTVHAFLSAPSHGVDFRKRKLVGMGHSAGGPPLILMQTIQPVFPFHAFILLDPAILPVTPSSRVLAGMFGTWAKSKKDTWPSRAQAYKELSRNKAFQKWEPKLVKLFVEHALREADESGTVTLACTGRQEAAYYKSSDIIGPPADVFVRLCEDRAFPIHLILPKKDEYAGKVDEMRAFLAEHVTRHNAGSVRWLDKGGHMLPQVAPALAANVIVDVLQQGVSPSAHL